MEESEIIERLNLVQADVSCVSGAVTKSSSTANEVFTDGDVRYVSHSVFRPFTSARQAAARLCRLNGAKLRLLSAWAVADDLVGDVKAGLAAINDRVDKAKIELAKVLPQARREWEAAHPEVLEYASRFPTDAQVLASIGMEVAIYKVHPMDHGAVPDGICSTVHGIAGQVLAEIAQDARDSFSPTAAKASARARDVLERMRVKVNSLAFVDASLGSVRGMLDSVLSALPATGPLTGNDFVLYAGLMNTLMDPERVVATASAVAVGGTDAAWSTFAPQKAVTPVSNDLPLVVSTDALIVASPASASIDALLAEVSNSAAGPEPRSWKW